MTTTAKRGANKDRALQPVTLKSLPPGKHWDGQGLHLVVTPEGHRRWQLKYRIAGRERMMGLGSLDTVTLKAARQRVVDLREQIRKGIDPLDQKREQRRKQELDRINSFEAFARTVHADVAKGLRNPKHVAQWLSSLKPAFEQLGDRPIASINETDLVEVIDSIMKKTPETGRRVRQRLAHIFAEAKRLGLRSDDPGAYLHRIRALRRPANGGHFAWMHYDSLPAFFRDWRANDHVSLSVKRALEFLALTATRSGDVRGATWEEINWKRAEWVIPSGRLKIKGVNAHMVPLSDRAIEILKEMKDTFPGGRLIFPSPDLDDTPMSDNAMSKPIREMLGKGAMTPHGLRTSFSTWANELRKAEPDVIEKCLAHTTRSVRSIYNRADYLMERRALLTEWARHLATVPAGEVVEQDAVENARQRRRSR